MYVYVCVGTFVGSGRDWHGHRQPQSADHTKSLTHLVGCSSTAEGTKEQAVVNTEASPEGRVGNADKRHALGEHLDALRGDKLNHGAELLVSRSHNFAVPSPWCARGSRPLKYHECRCS